ncbi:MAG: RsmE family RNA methyltransferase [Candidatus Cryptobacteroides sp.]
MELFYSGDIADGICRLEGDEASHCVKVLRHKAGDVINVIDGEGTLMKCSIMEASPKSAACTILESIPLWGAHPYRLVLAVCPTKNADRYEWLAEKACEIGVDTIVPLIGDRSERKVYRTDRLRRIVLSAAKQSLKGAVPHIREPLPVADFLNEPAGGLGLIAYCFEDETVPRISIKEALEAYNGNDVTVLIGPEGDFSPEEAALAVSKGYVPVHLGASRLRTETAAVTAASAVYFRYM